MMSDTATPDVGLVETESEVTAPTGELTELARLEIRVGKILEVSFKTTRSSTH